MNKFISLEEFLCFKDETGYEDRRFLTGKSWLEWYLLSKEAYDTHGDDGPPVDSKVITLRNGFGGLGGNILTLKVDNNKHYEQYFILTSNAKDSRVSLSYKKTWWRDFTTYPSDKIKARELENRIYRMVECR